MLFWLIDSCSIEISSGDDTRSVKSSKSTKRFDRLIQYYFKKTVWVLFKITSVLCLSMTMEVTVSLPLLGGGKGDEIMRLSVLWYTSQPFHRSKNSLVSYHVVVSNAWNYLYPLIRAHEYVKESQAFCVVDDIPYYRRRRLWVCVSIYSCLVRHLKQLTPSMLVSPTKSATQRVRFKPNAPSATPLKGVLKKPEVTVAEWVLSDINKFASINLISNTSDSAKSIHDGWDDDEFARLIYLFVLFILLSPLLISALSVLQHANRQVQIQIQRTHRRKENTVQHQLRQWRWRVVIRVRRR